MLEILDTWDTVFTCFQDGRFSLKRWEDYADAAMPGLKEKVLEDTAEYDFRRDILPVLQNLNGNRERASEAHESFLEAVRGLDEKLEQKLGFLPDMKIVFYLGLCSGAGWATELEGCPAVLLGLEKIVELSWSGRMSMKALLYHEIGHIWHFQVRGGRNVSEAGTDKGLWQLYSEGMAMYIEQLLCGEKHFYHQDKNGWLTWCADHREELYREYLTRLERGESLQPFFGDWSSLHGKSDTGYYLGGELIRSLAEKYSLRELAALELPGVEKALRAAAFSSDRKGRRV